LVSGAGVVVIGWPTTGAATGVATGAGAGAGGFAETAGGAAATGESSPPPPQPAKSNARTLVAAARFLNILFLQSVLVHKETENTQAIGHTLTAHFHGDGRVFPEIHRLDAELPWTTR
jgi:hypothetical protein